MSLVSVSISYFPVLSRAVAVVASLQCRGSLHPEPRPGGERERLYGELVRRASSRGQPGHWGTPVTCCEDDDHVPGVTRRSVIWPIYCDDHEDDVIKLIKPTVFVL